MRCGLGGRFGLAECVLIPLVGISAGGIFLVGFRLLNLGNDVHFCVAKTQGKFCRRI